MEYASRKSYTKSSHETSCPLLIRRIDRILELDGASKVAEFENRLLGVIGIDWFEEDIGALYVAMHNVVLVQAFDGLEERLGVVAYDLLRKTGRLAAYAVERRLVAAKLHEYQNLFLKYTKMIILLSGFSIL
jgi:hypothetical protein